MFYITRFSIFVYNDNTMNNLEKIISRTYTGTRDERDLPHGQGTIEYSSKLRPLYKYEGEWAHGMRQGKGKFYFYAPHYDKVNHIDQYSWYSEGDYDGARLIRPKHEAGSWEPFIRMWEVVYDGMWENDTPACTVGKAYKEMIAGTMKFNRGLIEEADRQEEMNRRFVFLVGEMRKNGEEMRLWKNVAIVRECMDILEEYSTTSLDKAEVCDTLLSLLSEYDVPRFALQIVRRQYKWLNSTYSKSDIVSLESIKAHIKKLEDYIDYENISNEEFMQEHGKMLNFDPIRRTQLWEDNICRWEEECDKRMGDAPRGMGFCFGYWCTFAAVLAEEGIEWKSPHQMNPGVIFD